MTAKDGIVDALVTFAVPVVGRMCREETFAAAFPVRHENGRPKALVYGAAERSAMSA
ncbi:hypothetical protein ACFUEN_35725 [Streptomyces griseorubiginosus]|uniref:hypothetical protein n=1 Tax=Streptomyces griseorubiginosus TaxID=67304 RepID=UPI00362A52D2